MLTAFQTLILHNLDLELNDLIGVYNTVLLIECSNVHMHKTQDPGTYLMWML